MTNRKKNCKYSFLNLFALKINSFHGTCLKEEKQVVPLLGSTFVSPSLKLNITNLTSAKINKSNRKTIT